MPLNLNSYFTFIMKHAQTEYNILIATKCVTKAMFSKILNVSNEWIWVQYNNPQYLKLNVCIIIIMKKRVDFPNLPFSGVWDSLMYIPLPNIVLWWIISWTPAQPVYISRFSAYLSKICHYRNLEFPSQRMH